MGGGFCEKHGPYDPPHTSCPFCAQEDVERRLYGPPPASGAAVTQRSGKPDRAPEAGNAAEPDFVRVTVEHRSEQMDDDAADKVEADAGADAPDEAQSDGSDSGQPHESSPPTEDDVTQIAPSQLLNENRFDEPSWFEGKPEPLAWMIVKWPAAQRGEMVQVRPNQIVGRQGDIRWDDRSLSRHHARFTLEPDAEAPEAPPVFHLWPFGPTNPVLVNGHLIRGATPLYENDEIHLGDTLFVFKTLLD